jgi:hypothetical protein
MRKTHRGSCHCGAVAFECEVDLAAQTSRCNCSICWKTRFWKAFFPAADFRLIRGEEALTDYTFGRGAIRHRFCKICGVKLYGAATFDTVFEGKELKGEFRAINIAALDDMPPEELDALPVQYEDGMHDRWDRAPSVFHYL